MCAGSAPAFTGLMREFEESAAIGELVERLARRFPQFSTDTVGDVVAGIHERFRDVRMRAFVPLLVEHDAVDRLAALARRDHRRSTPYDGSARDPGRDAVPDPGRLP